MAENSKRSNGPMFEAWRKLKRNKLAMVSLSIIILMVVLALIAPWILPYDYAAQDFASALAAPSGAHVFGTDNFGRDLFSRILYGSRYTVFIGFGCTTAAAIIGVVLGIIAAYFPKVDNIIMRTLDIIIGIPAMTLLMCLITVMGISLTNMIIALCITRIPLFARVARGQALTLKEQEYIEASTAIGASNWRILTRHILPNALAPIIIEYTMGVGRVILWSASLSFIGMGVQAPTPEWGLLVSAGRPYLRSAWWLSIIPGLFIMLNSFSLNILGDGLRDALDPRLNK